jgi:hypothetical protein
MPTNATRYILPVAIIAALIYSVNVLNKAMDRNAPASDDHDLASATGLYQAPKPAAPPAATPVADPVAPETTIGDPSRAKYKVTIGWAYDENQMNAPQSPITPVIGAATAWVNSHQPNASLEVVDLDVPKSALSPAAASVNTLGVAVNGKTTFKEGAAIVDLAGNPGVKYNAGATYGALHSIAP